MSAKKKRGRPKLEGTVLVRLRLSESVYDSYCRRAFRSELDVRTLLRRILTTRVDRGDLSAKEARALAISLFMSAEEIDRAALRVTRNTCAPKFSDARA